MPFTVGIEGAFSKFTCSSSGLSASVTELMPTDTNTLQMLPTFARSNAAAFSLNVHQLPASRGGPREGGHCSAAGCCHGIADSCVCSAGVGIVEENDPGASKVKRKVSNRHLCAEVPIVCLSGVGVVQENGLGASKSSSMCYLLALRNSISQSSQLDCSQFLTTRRGRR